MSGAQSLRATVPGLSMCIVLLLAPSSRSESCRGGTSPQGRVLHEPAHQPLAADLAENDETPVAADQPPVAEESSDDTEIEVPGPANLEDLLTTWEQKCTQIQSLRGRFRCFVYNGRYNTETRANGVFWYKAPNQARMDVRATTLPDPPITDKLGPDGEPFVLRTAENLRWIYTGREAFLIHDDEGSFEQIRIPPELQGGGIVVKPFALPLGMPFPDELRADAVKEQYHLSLGEQHWPEGRIIERDAEQIRLRPQLHVVAYPKLERDKRDWRRWEILLDGESFLPHAIRMLDPTMTIETVYVFDRASMKVNERLFLPSPFDERPAGDYVRMAQ